MGWLTSSLPPHDGLSDRSVAVAVVVCRLSNRADRDIGDPSVLIEKRNTVEIPVRGSSTPLLLLQSVQR
ncbi:hypothetical protein GWI33_008106 [Rhynchophorus ferrugineus]|uniref:Uncharacterized protein n=1 Tax=Rhynchophorus ferrugineus TaxID=354439 RepID=A0A834MEE2_RHYFE|nr:hypothetical protein GWI33_008106 [Rhynchophorus ferrugineus]